MQVVLCSEGVSPPKNSLPSLFVVVCQSNNGGEISAMLNSLGETQINQRLMNIITLSI